MTELDNLLAEICEDRINEKITGRTGLTPDPHGEMSGSFCDSYYFLIKNFVFYCVASRRSAVGGQEKYGLHSQRLRRRGRKCGPNKTIASFY